VTCSQRSGNPTNERRNIAGGAGNGNLGFAVIGIVTVNWVIVIVIVIVMSGVVTVVGAVAHLITGVAMGCFT
jgi:uncharacterized membrane protein